jgi:serine/threonine protein kinase
VNTPDDEKSYSAIGDTEYATTFRVDNAAGTPVEVLKVYRIASVEREEGAAGFAADVRALRSVDTPALVTPQEAGLTDAGAPYIRRSWIGSPSLADQLAQGSKLSTSDAVTVAVNLADVVSAMNNKRLLHLGVSPQNLFVRPDLSILLTDPLPRSTFLALQHARKERTAHVAPEILSGEPAKPASDSYSIMSTLMAALGDRELPESLEQLRDRCLADRPADRPMPGELAQLLREVGPSVEEFELTASQTAASAGATGEPGTGETGETGRY